MIELLIIGMFLAAFLQPSVPRFYAALMASLITMCHHWGYYEADGLLYYGSAALFDLVIILLLSGIYPAPALVVRLQVIFLASIVLNAAGFLMWFFYIPHDAYNAAFVGVYSWAIFTMLRRGKPNADRRGASSSGWNSCFRFDFGARRLYYVKNGSAV